MEDSQQKFIDIEKVINNKNPRLLKWLPRFIVNYLKKIIHQDEINEILYENRHKYDQDFCQDIIERFNIKIATKGLDNIPKKGGYIFASNHPLGGMDAIAIVSSISAYRKDIKFIVNDILLHLHNLSNLFVGVNKHGTSSKESLNTINQLFASDKAVFIFPAGLVSRKIKGKIADLPWKKTFITQAKKHQKSIIPVYVEGNLSNFFYRLANFRKSIGIKANIEMLYLANETFKQKNKSITIVVGEPIVPAFFDNSKSDAAWAKWMKDKVYQMKKDASTN